MIEIGQMETTNIILADEDYREAVKTVVIAMTLGGGLIWALIGAHEAMVKTLGGKNDAEEEEDPQNIKPDESFDPILMEKKNRQYGKDLGATGRDLLFAYMLFVSKRTLLANIVAILGRLRDVNTLTCLREKCKTYL
jgi:hypothetical protein